MILKKSVFHSGRIKAVGHKHSSVPLLASAISLKKICLTNLPLINDVTVLTEILVKNGACIQYEGDQCHINTENLLEVNLPPDLISQVHGSLYLIGPTLARFGHLVFEGSSGGCMIGDGANGGQRPTSHIVDVLQKFGAHFDISSNALVGSCSKLTGCSIDIMEFSDSSKVLTGPLVSGATKTAILASMTASGISRIYHPYPKPDASELLRFAQASGCGVKQQGHEIEITPIKFPLDKPAPFRVISDLSQIMTFICASVWFQVDIVIEFPDADFSKSGLYQEILVLEEMGVKLNWTKYGLECSPPEKLRNVDIDVTSVGIYSDHQPLFALMFLKGDKPVRIKERVWKNRFSYASGLRQLGGKLEVENDCLVVYPSTLQSCRDETLIAHDLRAAVVLLFAGLSVEHDVVLLGADHLKRGYENLIDDLGKFGANIGVESNN